MSNVMEQRRLDGQCVICGRQLVGKLVQADVEAYLKAKNVKHPKLGPVDICGHHPDAGQIIVRATVD